jgi:hypothetical protein
MDAERPIARDVLTGAAQELTVLELPAGMAARRIRSLDRYFRE